VISKFETLEKYRGRGYATLAVSAALEDALKKVSETSSLFVRKDNLSAIRIYEKLGFKKVGGGGYVDRFGNWARPVNEREE
jgi:predicted GNAT family acetyltransferase